VEQGRVLAPSSTRTVDWDRSHRIGRRDDLAHNVQETVEVGDQVAVRAYAGGTIGHDDDGQSLEAPFGRDVEWLAVYRVAADRIVEVNFLASADRHDVG